MIKICIVLALLVSVAQSYSLCPLNEMLTSTHAECGCVAGGASNPIAVNIQTNFCKFTGSAYAITLITSLGNRVCAADTQLGSGAECGAKAQVSNEYEAGTKFCQENQYKHGTNTCNWCEIGTTTKCLTCSSSTDSTKNQCGTCNPGYKTPAATTCTAYTCAISTETTGCKTCTGQASMTADNHCATCNEGYKISGTACVVKTAASSSMSLGIQTVLIIGIMNFM